MVLLWILALAAALWALHLLWRRLIFVRNFRFPGPRAFPVLGNCHLLLGSQQEHTGVPSPLSLRSYGYGYADDLYFFRLCWRLGDANPRGVYQLWVGMRPFVFLYKSHIVKPLVTSATEIEKNFEYSLTEDWLGQGLITSKGEMWQKQRKMLTSCFHFNILREFSQPVWRHSHVLLQKLALRRGEALDIVPLAKLLALDIICETAMGIDIGTQINSDSDYPMAISRMTEILSHRFITPWMKPKALFNLTSNGREYNKLLAKVQDFVKNIIIKRKTDLLQKNVEIPPVTKAEVEGREVQEETDVLCELHEEAETEDLCRDCRQPTCRTAGSRRRLALLDCLLQMSQDDPTISDKDITDQVNTFMFAGHDTIACALSFCLFALGHHPAWQDAIVEELDQWCPDLLAGEPEARMFLKGLPVLDRCVREAVRLYPPSPMIGRTINTPLETPEGTLPVGTTAIIWTFLLHRDPSVFKDPHVFNPDRFLPQNNPNDPFAYLPFSAGPRNCIGKNLATQELKIVLAIILKSFRVTSLQDPQDLDLSFEIVLTNHKGILLEFAPRS